MSVAVVLSGCGAYDGTEIHEASAVCVALTRAGKKVAFYAPHDKTLFHEVNHANSAFTEDTKRDVQVESARIARGMVTRLSDLAVDDFEAVVFPGGFGATKNLSSFGVEISEPAVEEQVARVLREFNEAGKPIGMSSISPILAAMVLSNPIKITLGRPGNGERDWPYGDKIIEIARNEYNATVLELDVGEVCVDEENKIVSTPAFLYEAATFHEVHDGVVKMVEHLLEMI